MSEVNFYAAFLEPLTDEELANNRIPTDVWMPSRLPVERKRKRGESKNLKCDCESKDGPCNCDLWMVITINGFTDDSFPGILLRPWMAPNGIITKQPTAILLPREFVSQAQWAKLNLTSKAHGQAICSALKCASEIALELRGDHAYNRDAKTIERHRRDLLACWWWPQWCVLKASVDDKAEWLWRADIGSEPGKGLLSKAAINQIPSRLNLPKAREFTIAQMWPI